MLALPAPGCDDDKVALVACGICLRRRKVEPAGHAFHTVHELPSIRAKKGAPRKEKEASSDDEPGAAGDASWKRKRKEGGAKTGALKLSPHLVGCNLYELLEVEEGASVETIKKQYRRLALQHHPDKHGGADAGATGGDKTEKGLSDKDMLFVKIQEAYEVLSDQAKRRQYDSSLDFDEDVPDEVDESIGFYATFSVVFQRNARWSTRMPVPELGSESTDISKVHKFYNFWFNFETWRDFSMHDEYNLDDAEFREEKRWMDRQNNKIRKKYVDDERRRIMRLTETAERLDPRIRAEREEREAKKREEKERRARAKQEEEDAKRQQEEERRQKEEREQAEREEKERIEREERKQKQQVTKGLRQRLRKSIQSRCKLDNVETEALQEFTLSLEADALQTLCDRLEPLSADKAKKAVLQELEAWRKKTELEREQQAKQRQEARQIEEQKANEAKAAAAAAASGPTWSTEELGVLAKGLQKFPGGTGGRWALIAKMLVACGYTRTEQEVVAKTKELSEGQSLKSMGSRLAANGHGTFVPPKAAAKAPEPKKAATNSGAAQANQEPTKAEATTNEWSAEQQKALEAALQKHPASLDKNERWRLIAEDVPGKTKPQCVERFKFLREQLQKAKG